MKRFILLFCLVLSFPVIAFAQSVDLSKIGEAKLQLENLQKQLWQIDAEQQKEVARLEKEIEIKGEFETTKQFEERRAKIYDRTSELYSELRGQTGARRGEFHKQINEILRTEFTGELDVRLGLYDADNQKFPINLTNGLSFETLVVSLNDAKELKENFSEAKVVGKLGLLLDRNNRAQAFLLSAKINFRGKSYQTISTDLSLIKGLNLFYGSYNAASKTSSWKTYETEDFENYSLMEASASGSLFKTFQENGVQKFLLVTQTVKPNGGCHACGATLGVAVFSKKDGYWKVDWAQKNLGEYGRWGELDEPSLAKIGKEKYALKFAWGDMHQGYEQGGDYYFALDNNSFRVILSYSTLADSSASSVLGEDQISVKGKVSFVEGSNPDYYDVKVLITGKKAAKVGKSYILKPYSKIEIYTYIGDKYQLVKK